jgi:hypothetical protein
MRDILNSNTSAKSQRTLEKGGKQKKKEKAVMDGVEGCMEEVRI